MKWIDRWLEPDDVTAAEARRSARMVFASASFVFTMGALLVAAEVVGGIVAEQEPTSLGLMLMALGAFLFAGAVGLRQVYWRVKDA